MTRSLTFRLEDGRYCLRRTRRRRAQFLRLAAAVAVRLDQRDRQAQRGHKGLRAIKGFRVYLAMTAQQAHKAIRASKASPGMTATLVRKENKEYRVSKACPETMARQGRRATKAYKVYRASKEFRENKAIPAQAALRSMRGR